MMKSVLIAAVSAVQAYLLGSIDTGILVSKFLYHDDVRKYGSGAAGMTNMLRTFGKKAAALTAENIYTEIITANAQMDDAEKWNVSQRWVAIYCKEGRIEGSIQKGRMWFIPVGTEKPIDPRKARKLEQNKSN